VLKQVNDPAHHVKRKLPERKTDAVGSEYRCETKVDQAGWVTACESSVRARADVARFDHGRRTFALIRDEQGRLFATDGVCTHGNTHLSGGLAKGGVIECPKHNGRFNLSDGSPARTPACRALATYPVGEQDGLIRINVAKAGGADGRSQETHQFRVVSNRNVATFIKELVLEPMQSPELAFTPGDYLQIDIPAYERTRFSDFDIDEYFAGFGSVNTCLS
jgi:MocE subfamily Rieske [2Fe-2S] domain protein